MSSPAQLSREASRDAKTRSPSDVESKGIVVHTHDVFDEEESGIDPVYQAKAKLLNDALQEIGMGKYQVSCISIPYARRTRAHCDAKIVVSVRCCRVRLVFVSSMFPSFAVKSK